MFYTAETVPHSPDRLACSVNARTALPRLMVCNAESLPGPQPPSINPKCFDDEDMFGVHMQLRTEIPYQRVLITNIYRAETVRLEASSLAPGMAQGAQSRPSRPHTRDEK